jgi:hypothetical protein
MNIHKVVPNFGDVNLPQKNNLHKKPCMKLVIPSFSRAMHISKRRATSLIKASPLVQDSLEMKNPRLLALSWFCLLGQSLPTKAKKKDTIGMNTFHAINCCFMDMLSMMPTFSKP